MTQHIRLYQSRSFDPYYNLAVEQHLLETVPEDTCILYLWQNENTVVIGRNQNPWKECRTTLLEQEGGHLARRLSGGGAVFHDLGNLNFTFLVSLDQYNLDRQLTVIQQAVCILGIHAERSGRNDVLAEGRKFSGNAFYKSGKRAYHHGTLLVCANMDKLSRYLNPSPAKLHSKGVDSVRSRVVNLQELNSNVTIETLKSALIQAFCEVYRLPVSVLEESALDSARVEALAQHNRSWEWNYGLKLPFSFACEDRFPWGSVQVCAQIESGLIQDIHIYSDAMDWAFVPALEQKMLGCRFSQAALQECLQAVGTQTADDICTLLCSHCL